MKINVIEKEGDAIDYHFAHRNCEDCKCDQCLCACHYCTFWDGEECGVYHVVKYDRFFLPARLNEQQCQSFLIHIKDKWLNTPSFETLLRTVCTERKERRSSYLRDIWWYAQFCTDIDKADDSGQNALHIACANGDLEAAFVLIQLGADAHKVNANRLLPYQIAKQYGHISCAEGILVLTQ